MKNYSKTIVCSLVLTSTLATISHVDAMMQQDERTAPDTITTGEYLLLFETKKDFLARFITEDSWKPLTSSHYILNDIIDSCPCNDMKQKLAIFGFHIALRYIQNTYNSQPRICSYLGCSAIQKYLPTSILVSAFEDLNSDEKITRFDHCLKVILADELKQRDPVGVFDYDEKSKDE